jgi:hypothetical protein
MFFEKLNKKNNTTISIVTIKDIMNLNNIISRMYEVFDPTFFAIRPYKRVSSKDHSSYLIFEKHVLEEDLGGDSENNSLSCLLWIMFFHDLPHLMRVEDFNEGCHINRPELRDKMEQLARHLGDIRKISLVDCATTTLWIGDEPMYIRLNVLDTLCDGKSTWNQCGYKIEPREKQDVMDQYNQTMIEVPLRVLMAQFYCFDDNYHSNNQPNDKLNSFDMKHPYVREFWDRPAKEFFQDVREKVQNTKSANGGQYTWNPETLDLVLRLLTSIEKEKYIRVTGEFDYILKEL